MNKSHHPKKRIPEWAEISRITSFEGILNVATYLGSVYGPKRLAVIAAEDGPTLKSVDAVRVRGIAESILIGDKNKITKVCQKEKIPVKEYTIIDQPDNKKAAMDAVKLIREGKADFLMKGLVQTATVIKAALDKEKGLRTDHLLSHVTVFEAEGFDRLMLMSDAGINIEPEIDEKRQIIENAISIANALGIDQPKVALLAAVETISEKMKTAVDDASLAKMGERGQIKGAVIDGPLALDDAISMEVAQAKGFKSPVAGKTDIFIVDDIDVGNVFYKMLVYFARAKVAGIVAGAKVPIVVPSRADTHEIKLYSIAVGAIIAHQIKLPS